MHEDFLSVLEDAHTCCVGGGHRHLHVSSKEQRHANGDGRTQHPVRKDLQL